MENAANRATEMTAAGRRGMAHLQYPSLGHVLQRACAGNGAVKKHCRHTAAATCWAAAPERRVSPDRHRVAGSRIIAPLSLRVTVALTPAPSAQSAPEASCGATVAYPPQRRSYVTIPNPHHHRPRA